MTELLSLLQEIAGLLSFGGHDGVEVAVAPLLVGAAISAASSIGNAIFGSRSAAKQRREQLAALRRERDANRAWYNRRYNEDATQRADAQLMMSRVNAYNKKRTQAALGKKNVIGGTDATLATTQQANAEAVGNALGDIVTNAESRKDNIESQYRSRDHQLANAENEVNVAAETAKRAAVAQAATGALKTAGSIVAGEDAGGGDGGVDEVTRKAVESNTLNNNMQQARESMERLRQDSFGEYDRDPWTFAHRN